MCNGAPVANAAWRDVQLIEDDLYYLGICGDFAHSLRVSGHNCGRSPGGVESPINGVGYDPNFCHALDIGHGGDRAKAKRMRDRFLQDPRVRYVIDNGTGYYPAHRGGGTFTSSGHDTHLHVSFMPGSTHNVAPFFGPPPPPPVQWPLGKDDKGFAVLLLEIVLVHCGFENVAVDDTYGEQTQKASQEMQKFLKRKVRPQTTRRDFVAFLNWSKFAGASAGPGERIFTISDSGPLVQELRRNLRKIGKDVKPTGRYDAEVQEAVREVQRFFDMPHKAGNCGPKDRQFIRYLAKQA